MEKISASAVVLPDRVLGNASIVIEQGRITAIEPGRAGPGHFENSLILPGFIDLHTHGRLGQDTEQLNADLLLKYACTGTTSLLPTYGCGPFDAMLGWLDGTRLHPGLHDQPNSGHRYEPTG